MVDDGDNCDDADDNCSKVMSFLDEHKCSF